MKIEGGINPNKEIRLDSRSNDYEKHVDRVSNMNLIKDIADLQSRIEAIENLSKDETSSVILEANKRDVEHLEDALLSLYDQLKTNIILSRDSKGGFASSN